MTRFLERSTTRGVRAVACAVTVWATLVAPWRAAAADLAAPSPRPSSPPGPTLPHLFSRDSILRVSGKIVESTRGRSGPVRLEIARADGGHLAALLASDARCDELGLSLRVGDQVELEGSLYQGRSPILVVTGVVVDGRTIPVRDTRGAPSRPGARAGAQATPAP